jgi:hypothetical protein
MIPLCPTPPSTTRIDLAASHHHCCQCESHLICWWICVLHPPSSLLSSGAYAYAGPKTKQGTCNNPRSHRASYQHPPALFHSNKQEPHETPLMAFSPHAKPSVVSTVSNWPKKSVLLTMRCFFSPLLPTSTQVQCTLTSQACSPPAPSREEVVAKQLLTVNLS